MRERLGPLFVKVIVCLAMDESRPTRPRGRVPILALLSANAISQVGNKTLLFIDALREG